jgi:hypothetical protein
MQGLGDAFAALPTVRALTKKYDEVILKTPWPQVFDGVPRVRFMRPPNSNLRWQQRNIEAWFDKRAGYHGPEPFRWSRDVELTYSFGPERKSIPEQFAECAGVSPDWSRFAMPRPNHHFRKLGLFRQATLRTEYYNAARNPDPFIIPGVLDMLARMHGTEWLHVNGCFTSPHANEVGEDDAPFYTKCAMAVAEQFSLGTLIRFVEQAACIVAPVSWLAWAGFALGTPTLCVMGGFASRKKIFGPLEGDHFMTLSPDPACECFNPSHKCEKSIPWESVEKAVDLFRIIMR